MLSKDQIKHCRNAGSDWYADFGSEEDDGSNAAGDIADGMVHMGEITKKDRDAAADYVYEGMRLEAKKRMKQGQQGVSR